MTIDEMFGSLARSTGDLAGVFEYDGETGYFYLYKCKDETGQKVAGEIHIVSGMADFQQTDIAICWDEDEKRVGLFICGQVCAVFDVDRGAKYGGEYRRGLQTLVPPEILSAFKS